MIPISYASRDTSVAELSLKLVAGIGHEVLGTYYLVRPGICDSAMSVRLAVLEVAFILAIAKVDRTGTRVHFYRLSCARLCLF